MFVDNVIDHEFRPATDGKGPNPEGGPTRREEPGSTVQLRAGESTYRLAVDLQGRTDVGAVATADHSMMSRTGPPCDRYFGHFGSWHRNWPSWSRALP